MQARTIEWQAKSRYALVTCFNNGRGAIVEKEIAPENVNVKNVLWVNTTSRYFRGRLRALGVQLAEPYTFAKKGGKAIQCSPYVGPDLDKVFQEGRATPAILEKLLSTISGVLSQADPEVGIDARLSNFCLAESGDVYYVDTFPPLVKYRGEFIVHFPNPTEKDAVERELKRKFEPLGILRRLRFSILAQDAGIDELDILMVLRRVMDEAFCDRVQNFFRTLPDRKEVGQALAELTLDDPDAIRELALRFMPPRGDARKQFFSEVFDLSSNFCPEDITDEERMSRLHGLFVCR